MKSGAVIRPYDVDVHRKIASVYISDVDCLFRNLRQHRDRGYDLASASVGNAQGPVSAKNSPVIRGVCVESRVSRSLL
jgi:hypothetical protein